jgi:hypothetical protein
MSFQLSEYLPDFLPLGFSIRHCILLLPYTAYLEYRSCNYEHDKRNIQTHYIELHKHSEHRGKELSEFCPLSLVLLRFVLFSAFFHPILKII